MSSIRDVAKLANVSPATASRILSHDPTFKTKPETQQSVLNAAKELNYQAKKKNTSSFKYNIGCILAITSEKYSDPYFTSILSSIEAEGNEYGINVSSIKNYHDLDNPQTIENIKSLQLDGLISMESLHSSTLKKLQSFIPAILFIDSYTPGFNNISFDHIDATYEIMDHLIYECGCKRIAYIGGGAPNSDFYSSLRLIAYRESLRKANITYDPTIVCNCNWDVEECATMTKKLLLSNNRPDAIFAGSDSMAYVIFGIMHELKLKCPQDVSVIGFNDLATSRHSIPPLTTVDVPTAQLGAYAVKRIYEMLEYKDQNVIKSLFPTKLIIRKSTNMLGGQNE